MLDLLLTINAAALILFLALTSLRSRPFVGFAMAFFILAETLCVLLPSMVPASNLFHSTTNWAGKLYECLLSALVLFFLWRRGATDIGLEWPSLKAWGMTIAATLAFIVIDRLLVGAQEGGGPAGTEMLAFEAIAPGLAEELAYRGVLYAIAALVWPVVAGWRILANPGVLAVSAFFGFIHGLEPTTAGIAFHWSSMFLPAIAALYFAWVRAMSRSIIAPIAAHNAVNLGHLVPF